MFASPIARLVQQLAKLPGVGEKTAARLAFHILRASPEDAAALASAITDVRQKIRFCSVCCDLTEADFSNAQCSQLDLRRARLVGVKGVGYLKGAIISADQLLGLAPGMAHALGMELRIDEDE